MRTSYRAASHKILPFRAKRISGNPILLVSTRARMKASKIRTPRPSQTLQQIAWEQLLLVAVSKIGGSFRVIEYGGLYWASLFMETALGGEN